MEPIPIDIVLSYHDDIPLLVVKFDTTPPNTQLTLNYLRKILPTTCLRQSEHQFQFMSLESVYTTLEILLSHQHLLTCSKSTLAQLEEFHLKLSLDYFIHIRQRPLPPTWQHRDLFISVAKSNTMDVSSHSVERVQSGVNDTYILKRCYIEDRQEFEPAIAALVRTLTHRAPAMFSTYKKRRAKGNISREIPGFQSLETVVNQRITEHMKTLRYAPEEEETVFNELLQSKRFAVKAIDLIDQGIVEAIRVQDLLQHDDAQSTNTGLDKDGQVWLLDFERYLWPMTCQNFGYLLGDQYSVGNHRIPVLQSGQLNAELIRHITLPNPNKRYSLQQSSESVYLDMTGLEESAEAKRRNIRLFLKFLLLPESYFRGIATSYLGSNQWQETFIRYLTQHQQNLTSICMNMPEFECTLANKNEIFDEFRTMTEVDMEGVERRWTYLAACVDQPQPPIAPIKEVIEPPPPPRDEQADLAYLLKLKVYIEKHPWQVGWQRSNHKFYINVDGEKKLVPAHVYQQYQRLLHLLESEFDVSAEKAAIVQIARSANAQWLPFFRKKDTRHFYRRCAADTLDFEDLDPNNIAVDTIKVY